MCKSVEGISGWKGQLLDWIAWFGKAALIPIAFIMISAWWRHEERIDAVSVAQLIMEANRFTSEDGLEVWREISRIRSDLDQKAPALGAEPVRENITKLEGRVSLLEQRVMRAP